MTEPTWMHEQFEPTGSSIGFRIVRKLDEVQSPFQKIEIFESTDWGNLMLIDGAMMLTTRDNFFYHEMIAHPALARLPRAPVGAASAAAVMLGGCCISPRNPPAAATSCDNSGTNPACSTWTFRKSANPANRRSTT